MRIPVYEEDGSLSLGKLAWAILLAVITITLAYSLVMAVGAGHGWFGYDFKPTQEVLDAAVPFFWAVAGTYAVRIGAKAVATKKENGEPPPRAE